MGVQVPSGPPILFGDTMHHVCLKCGCIKDFSGHVCPVCRSFGTYSLDDTAEVIEKCRELDKQSQEQLVAIKNDAGKPDMTLVTYAMLEDAVKVLMFGEKKYARFNYRNPSPGFEQRLLAAVMRHMTKANGGEELDDESGLPHLAHALATLLMVFDRRAHVKEKKE